MKKIEKQGQVRTPGKSEDTPGIITIEGMTTEEFRKEQGKFSFGEQLLDYMENIHYCKGEPMGECILGTLVIPDRKHLLGTKRKLGYYMDGARLCLIGDGENTDFIMQTLEGWEIRETMTTTADMLTGYFNLLLQDEALFLQKIEEKLTGIEEELAERIPKDFYQTVIRYRRQLLVLYTYYEQLIDMADVLKDSDNEMLNKKEKQLLNSFQARAERLHSHVEMLREYVLQIRELYQTQLDLRQEQSMNYLAVITSLFLPLNLLVGWYGMNFVHMPELRWQYGYLSVIAVFALILFFEIRFFRKKGLL